MNRDASVFIYYFEIIKSNERMVIIMNTNDKIEELSGKILGLIGDDKESMKWFSKVKANASALETEEKVTYLESILAKLKDSSDEEDEDTDEIREPKKVWPIWLKTILFLVSVITFIAIVVTASHFLSPRNVNTVNSSVATSSTISSANLPKEDFQVIDYKVDGNDVVYNRQIANTQHKVFANGSDANTLSANAENAVNEMVQYMSHNATALKEKAMTFGIINAKADVKDWLEKKEGKVYYNSKGKDVFYQTKAFLSRSRISYKKMEDNSNYYTTGVNDKGDVVISKNALDLSGQEYVEVSNPEGSTEKYSYCVLVYCGNTVMQSNNIPGIPTEKIEIPKPNKPDKPGEPSKPSEGKVSPKDPGKDPANQGKALVGGGQNDGSSNNAETSQAKLPESYSAPTAPSAPAQDARVSEPSQWSGAGTVTDSNGSTKVEENGAVTTPDGRKYDGLVGKSAPKVESGANDTTKPSSSANFAGVNGSMSQPAIDD